MIDSQHISAQQKAEFFQQIADTVNKHRMSVPVIFMLESFKPLSTLLYSAALVSTPVLSAIIGTNARKKLAALMESRADVEELICLIEARNERTAKI